jgi:hypothetical protein
MEKTYPIEWLTYGLVILGIIGICGQLYLLHEAKQKKNQRR